VRRPRLHRRMPRRKPIPNQRSREPSPRGLKMTITHNNSFMKMYWGDLLKDTLDLDQDEFGAFVLLIAHYFNRGGPIPDNDDSLRIASRCRTTRKWRRIRNKLISLFVIKDGYWFNARIDREINEANMRSASAAQSAEHRWRNAPRNAPRTRTIYKNTDLKGSKEEKPVDNSPPELTNSAAYSTDYINGTDIKRLLDQNAKDRQQWLDHQKLKRKRPDKRTQATDDFRDRFPKTPKTVDESSK